MITLNASELPRVLVCLGSVALNEPLDTQYHETEAAREGTAAHWVAEQALMPAPIDLGRLTEAPNGYPVTDEMREAARAYADYIGPDAQVEDKGEFYATKGVAIRWRADAWGVDEVGEVKFLDLCDLKFGYRLVEVVGNAQLVAYAVGVIRAHGERMMAQNAWPDRVRLSIYQPRPFHPEGAFRTWELSIDELIAAWSAICDQLEQLPSEALVTGPNCGHCAAAIFGTCPTFLAASQNAIDVATRGSAIDVPAEALGKELDVISRAAEMLKQRHEYLKDIVTRKIRDGVPVNGWAVEPQFGHRKWIGTPEEWAKAWAEKEGKTSDLPMLNKLTDLKPVTPAEAVRRGMPEDVMKQHTQRPSGGSKLIRRDGEAHAAKKLGTPDA